MRSVRTLFLPLLLLLLCACQPPRPPAAGVSADEEIVPLSAPITVVTLNLWHDKQDWPRRQQVVLDVLREIDPDVVLLQEVLQDQGLPNQAQSLAEALGHRWQYRFYSNDAEGRARRYGNAILTRHRIVAIGQQALEPREDYRVAGFARLDIGGRPLNVYVTHLHHEAQGAALRQRQAEGVMAFVAATREGAPSLVGGDFNTADDAPELQSIAGGYDSACAPVPACAAMSTLNPHMGHPPRRIDHLFIQRGAFRVQEARVLFDQPDGEGVWASDHFGVLATLRPLAWLPRR